MARPTDVPASGRPQVVLIGPAGGAAHTFDPLLVGHGYAVLPIPPRGRSPGSRASSPTPF